MARDLISSTGERMRPDEQIDTPEPQCGFKAKEALKGDQTVAEIAAKHGIHPTLVNEGKRTLTQGATGIFERGASRTEKNAEALTDELFRRARRIGARRDPTGCGS